MNKVLVDNLEKKQWDEYACDFADHNIYQTLAYQTVRADMSHFKISHVVIRNESDKVIAMCLVRIKHIKPLNFKIGYVQWGPLICKNGNLGCSIEVLEMLRDVYVGKKVDVLRLVPNVCANHMGLEVTRNLEKSGFHKTKDFAPYRTNILELGCSDQQLRHGLHQSWRRMLKKSEAAGIKIVEQNDDAAFAILEKLYLRATQRKGFRGLNPKEFTRTQRVLSSREKMCVIIGYCDGEPVTAHLTSRLGKTALLLLAASNEKGLATRASYLSWWQAIISANRNGMEKYDVGGIDFENNPTVSRFKSGMGGDEFMYIGAFESYSNAYSKKLWRVIEKGHSVLKRGK